MALTYREIAELFQIITAEIRFLNADEGGRRISIDLTPGTLYRPHLVVQDRHTRQAQMNGNVCSEPYVSMTFIDGPENYRNGESGIFRFFCPYWTHPDHPQMNSGTEFTIREGHRIVAGGTVVSTAEPSAPNRQRTSWSTEET